MSSNEFRMAMFAKIQPKLGGYNVQIFRLCFWFFGYTRSFIGRVRYYPTGQSYCHFSGSRRTDCTGGITRRFWRKMEDEMFVKFQFTYQGRPRMQFGVLNVKTMEVRLPSGTTLPVFNGGFVEYLGQVCQLLDRHDNPVRLN